MPSRWRPVRVAQQPPHHPQGGRPAQAGRAPTLYELVLREAIATQHRLVRPGRYDLRACDECGKPYLLATVWQRLSEEGTVSCPACGTEAIAWDGARGYMAYWHRAQILRNRRDRLTSARAPVAR